MYMPSLRSDLAEAGNGLKFPSLRTVIFCLEDSIAEADLPLAMDNLEAALPKLQKSKVHRFIRPRNLEVLARLLSFPGIESVEGFVIPKADRSTLPGYLRLLEKREGFLVMPTLETRAVFDLGEMYRLRDYLISSPLRGRVPLLRVGSMDLLGILSLRRDLSRVIYETPVGHVIDQLITVFKPADLSLSAPGFEGLDNPEVLAEELSLDVGRGLFGKTCVHPAQVEAIHSAYKVSAEELEMAEAILDTERPAVFRLGGRMCEKAVHTNWAVTVLERARIFGSIGDSPIAYYHPSEDSAFGPRA
jgi:citrate lyase beta subunit